MNLDELFQQSEDQPLPGGCDLCDAYQTVSVLAGVLVTEVHHDDWCAFLRTNSARSN
jgi:hypothetical protein